ncbi:MAG TPA: EamA family transporter [Acidiphilium sp.]
MTPKHGATLGRMTGPGLALGSMSSSQLGAVLSVPLMVAHGSLGISATRLVWAAVFSLVLARPDFRRFSRRQWRAAATLGVVVAFMTLCYFMAVTLIPVGPAITIDFLGPLSVAVVALRGWPRFVLPVLAAFGVLAMSYSPHGWLFDPLGILFALGAGAGWAGYIVLMRHVGRLFSAQDGLCLSFIIASVVAMPVAIALDPPAHWIALVPEVAGIALLSPLIPFVFEMAALRRMDMGTFSILMSLEPAIGTLLGFVLLGQVLAAQQVLGVLAVMTASIAAVLLSSVKRHEPLADRKPCAAPGD